MPGCCRGGRWSPSSPRGIDHHHGCLAIFTVRQSCCTNRGLTTVGEIVMFVSFATMLIQKLEQVVSFINSVFMEAPRLQEFFNVLDAVPGGAATVPTRSIPGPAVRAGSNSTTSRFSYDGKRPAVEDLSLQPRYRARTIALVGPDRRRQVERRSRFLHRAFDPQSGFIKIDGMDVRGLDAHPPLRRNIGVVFQEALLFNRSIADNLPRRQGGTRTMKSCGLAAARAPGTGNHRAAASAGSRTMQASGGAHAVRRRGGRRLSIRGAHC